MIQLQTRSSFIVVGDVMVDTFARTDGSVTIGVDQTAVISSQVGGQAANTAAWLAWLQSSVTLIAACGDDSAGQWATERLVDVGVHPHVHRVGRPTGSCVVIVDSHGTRTMFSDPGANQLIANFAVHEVVSALRSVDLPGHVHLSGYLLERDQGLLRSLLESVRIGFPSVTTSLDTAALVPTAANRDGLVSALPYLDVLIGTLEELACLADLDPIASLSDDAAVIERWRTSFAFPGVVVIKRGRDGATADDAHERHRAAAPSVGVVDTTGAGDAFSAGFLAAWTSDQGNLAAALRSGSEAAATAIARLGAGPPSAEGR